MDRNDGGDSQGVNQAGRDAIDAQIETRRNDKDFQERLAKVFERNKAAFELLAK